MDWEGLVQMCTFLRKLPEIFNSKMTEWIKKGHEIQAATDPAQEDSEGKCQDVSWDQVRVERRRVSGSNPRKSRESKEFYITPKEFGAQ